MNEEKPYAINYFKLNSNEWDNLGYLLREWLYQNPNRRELTPEQRQIGTEAAKKLLEAIEAIAHPLTLENEEFAAWRSEEGIDDEVEDE